MGTTSSLDPRHGSQVDDTDGTASPSSPAIVDVWLLALANVAVFDGLLLFEFDRLVGDQVWRLGYLTATLFCFAFWLALGTAKWWHRAGQMLLVTSTPLIMLWGQDSGPGPLWLMLGMVGTLSYSILRLLRVRLAPPGATDHGTWQWSLQDMLVAMVLVGLTYKLWQAESGPANESFGSRWQHLGDEWQTYAILATHGGLLILPALWLFLRPHPLSLWRWLAAIVLTILIGAFDCWLIGPLLSRQWQWPLGRDLFDFWRRHVWQPQLAIVAVAVLNGLAWRWLGWRLVMVPQRTITPAPAS